MYNSLVSLALPRESDLSTHAGLISKTIVRLPSSLWAPLINIPKTALLAYCIVFDSNRLKLNHNVPKLCLNWVFDSRARSMWIMSKRVYLSLNTFTLRQVQHFQLHFERSDNPNDVLPTNGTLAEHLAAVDAGCHVATFQYYTIDRSVHADSAQIIRRKSFGCWKINRNVDQSWLSYKTIGV